MGLGLFRFYLAFLVAISHLWGGMIGGPAAYSVWGFYLISGYLMAYILSNHYGFDKKGLVDFYTNRSIRIYPGYFFALFFGVICYKLSLINGVSLDALNPEFGRPNSVGSFLFNITLLPFFQTNKLFVPVSSALGLEVGFYLLAPLIAISRNCTVLALIITAGINFKLQIDPGTFAIRYSGYWTGLFAFVVGVTTFQYKKYLIKFAHFKISIFLWILQFYLIEINMISPWGYGLYISLIFTAYVLISCCDLKSSKLDLILGDMSYIVYLMHTTIGYFILIFSNKIVPRSFEFFLITFIITCLIAYITVRFFEKPIQGWLKKII